MIEPMARTQGLYNLVYLFIMANPSYSADRIYAEWKQNKILKEYRRPSLKTIKNWVSDTYLELEQKGIYFN